MTFTADDINKFNILGQFCGQRDLPSLTQTDLQQKYNFKQADIFVLFGGSILYGVDVLAQAIKQQVAKKYLIVGGFGHTTAVLQQTVMEKYPDIPAINLQEAEIFAAMLKKRFNLTVDYLETESTNCGNNITYLLALLKKKQINFDSIILSQDATMQRRMGACLQKYVDPSIKIINYATYQVELISDHDKLIFGSNIPGMWTTEHYQRLLMGEIPRLQDNKTGYGPQGKGFITHVDIPDTVQNAYQELQTKFPNLNRPSNNLYASKKI